MWIEGVKALPNGHRRTLDVIIQKDGGGGTNSQMGFSGGGGRPSGMMGSGSGLGGRGAGGGAGSGDSFTVDIIVIDTVDPKNASPSATTDGTP
jgi:hypothetical protein